MSYISKLKKKLNYDSQTPRCLICKNYRRGYIKLTTDSRTVKVDPMCNVMCCHVKENGLCDKWVSAKDGAVLDVG